MYFRIHVLYLVLPCLVLFVTLLLPSLSHSFTPSLAHKHKSSLCLFQLLVYFTFCHNLCERNKIYKFSSQSNIYYIDSIYIKKIWSVFVFILCCYCCRSIMYYVICWMLSISMDCDQFNDNNIVQINFVLCLNSSFLPQNTANGYRQTLSSKLNIKPWSQNQTQRKKRKPAIFNEYNMAIYCKSNQNVWMWFFFLLVCWVEITTKEIKCNDRCQRTVHQKFNRILHKFHYFQQLAIHQMWLISFAKHCYFDLSNAVIIVFVLAAHNSP